MEFQENIDLLPLNGLRLPCRARWFCKAADKNEFIEAAVFARDKRLPIVVLGDGANLVPADDLNALVMQVVNRGVTFDGGKVTACAGENWHRLVARCVEQGLGGIENLALIPGRVGAAPIQNIGAYGVELSASLTGLTALNLETFDLAQLGYNDCEFAYRDSRFKREPEWLIMDITLSLATDWQPMLAYPGISDWLEQAGRVPDLASVFDAVVAIRREKLPDPASSPNVGSFFKNPVVPEGRAYRLRRDFPGCPVFPGPDGRAKLSAAWLIDQAGLKGTRVGGCVVSRQHALVIVNQGGGTWADLSRLVGLISGKVQARYGLYLEIEPSIYPLTAIT